MSTESLPSNTHESDVHVEENAPKGIMTKETVGQWFNQYHTQLTDSIHRYTGDVSMAEEVLQNTFLRCLNIVGTQHSFRGESAEYAWLWKVARNELVNLIRKNAMQQKSTGELDALPIDEIELIIDPRAPNVSDMLIVDELRTAVQRTLQHIGPTYIDAIKLCDMDGMKYEEIAQALKVPVGTVRSRIKRGREEFREKFMESPPQPTIESAREKRRRYRQSFTAGVHTEESLLNRDITALS